MLKYVYAGIKYAYVGMKHAHAGMKHAHAYMPKNIALEQQTKRQFNKP